MGQVRKILICPDSFKGTMTALESAEVMAEGAREALPEAEITLLPLGDGGEGTIAALAGALPQVSEVRVQTVDALRRPIEASYIISNGNTALIEAAAASGLTMIGAEERDIMRADTYGTGLLIADAWRRGINRFIVGMGGTATCDGGIGALEAMQTVMKPYGGAEGLQMTLLCDVKNPLCGPEGAAAVFGPQKGATPAMIPILDARLAERAEEYARGGGINVRDKKYAGAAGGLAGMLMACYGAEARQGIAEVLELLDFDRRVIGADLVITGEGRGDLTTLNGKAPRGVLDAAGRHGVPVALVCGCIADGEALREAGFRHVVSASRAGAAEQPQDSLRKAVRSMLRRR